MTAVYIKVARRPEAPTEVGPGLRGRVFAEVRRALLRGESVILPGLGRLVVQQGKGYVLAHPDGDKSRSLREATKVVFQPERSLLHSLNEDEGGAG